MLEHTTVSLPTLVTAVFMSVSWAAGLAGVYYGLRNRISSGESRMDRHSQRLDEGKTRFATIEARVESIDTAHRETSSDHSGRLIRLETLFGAMDGKLDIIVSHVKSPK